MITRTTTIRIPSDLRTELDRLVLEEGTTQSQIIFQALRLYIEVYKSNKGE